MNVIDDSYESISESLGFKSCLPYTPDWAAAPDFLKIIVDHCLENRPETIVECSSGLTSLVLARCCQLNGVGHVYSLENGDEYAGLTKNNLKAYGLDEYADIIHAPLCNIELDGESFDWYQLVDDSLSAINMLVIDGPSGFIQRHSRYPAVPVMYDKLADGCQVFLDDASRQDEKEIVERWLHAYSNIEHSYIDNMRGCSILKLL